MVFCGFLTQLMNGRKSISDKTGTNSSPVKTDMRSKYSPDLRVYTSACKKEPSLKSFDSLLHQRTNEVIKSLASRADTETLPVDSLMDVYGFLAELNQDAVRFIIENREDVWKNKELRSLVDFYFKSTAKTLDLCNTVENCVKKAEIGQLIIRYAVKLFEKESADTEGVSESAKIGGNKKKYAKTLEELNKFAAMGDPFDVEFVTQYESVYEQQVLLLEELHKQKVKLDKKHKNAKTWRILSNVVFATAVATVIILSVVLAAMNVPQVASAVASGLSYPIDKAGNWCGKMWKNSEKAVKRQRDLVKTVDKHATGNKEATETIRTLVDNLRIKMSSIMKRVEFALEREEEDIATRIAMEEIKKKVEEFTGKLEDVGQKVAGFSRLVAVGRIVVLEHIVGLPAHSV